MQQYLAKMQAWSKQWSLQWRRLIATAEKRLGRRLLVLSRRRLLCFALLGVVIYHVMSVMGGLGFAALRSRLEPEAILVLGGSYYVERYAAEVALDYPNIPVFVSSGRAQPCSYKVFVDEAGVRWSRVKLDFRAKDTFGNFLTSYSFFATHDVRKVLVVTMEGHWPRSKVLSLLMFSTNGIAVEARTIPGEGEDETKRKLFLDGLRAALWRVVGAWIVPYSLNSETYVLNQRARFEAECQSDLPGKIPEFPSKDYGPKLSKEQQLFRAIEMADDRLVYVLLRAGVSANAFSEEHQQSALERALAMRRDAIVELLREFGATL